MYDIRALAKTVYAPRPVARGVGGDVDVCDDDDGKIRAVGPASCDARNYRGRVCFACTHTPTCSSRFVDCSRFAMPGLYSVLDLVLRTSSTYSTVGIW